MPRIAREVDDAFRAVTLTRLFLAAGAPDARRLDLELWKLLKRGSAMRAELATQLAQLPHGPALTLRGLACGPAPDVAGPVLEHSAALTDAAIAEMARCKGDAHLRAIASRPHLHEKITSILVRRGDLPVLTRLSENRSASFTLDGRHTLERRLRHEANAAPA